MFKTRKAAYLIIILLLCFSMAIPANAAIYDISDFFEYNAIDKETDTRTAYFEVDVSPYVRVLDADSSVVATGYGSTDWRFPQLDDPRYAFSVHIYPFGGLLHTNAPASDCVLDVSDIMDGTDVVLSADFECSVTTTQTGCNLDFDYRTFILAYDANMKLISTTKTDWASATLIREGTQEFENQLSYTLPRNTFYIGMITQTKWTSPYSIGTMSFCISPRPVTLSVSIDMIYEQSQTMDKISNKLDDIGGQLGDVNDKLDDIINRPEQEKNEASQGANDAFSGAVDVVPDHQQDLVGAFSGLATSLSYSGTAAKLDIPSVALPGIDGVYDGFVILESQPLDFEIYFQMLPENLLLLVQSLFTAALIVFCFKELYGCIQYAMTLKG